jgi:hypothetical protein
VNVVEPSAGRYADCLLHPLHMECLLKTFQSPDGTREVSNLCPTCRREIFQRILRETNLTPVNFDQSGDHGDDDDEGSDSDTVDEEVGFNSYLSVSVNQESTSQNARMLNSLG